MLLVLGDRVKVNKGRVLGSEKKIYEKSGQLFRKEGEFI